MEIGTREWRQMCFAFYGLAHNSRKEYDELPQHLKETEEGQLCAQIIEDRSYELIDRVGRLLTGGSKHWYTYIGRM